MNSKEIISKVSSKNLSQEETAYVMQEIFFGKISDQEIENFLLGLSKKGETSDELTGAVLAMRAASLKVDLKEKVNLVDCCGTGGLGKSMMNVSTTAGLVSAAAKVKIAKHGNRTATGKSGSADVLEVANVNLSLSPNQVAKCIEEIGIGFMFAQNFHPGMKYVMPVRKRIADKTIFNLLGPLTNPAGAKRQCIGVYDPKWVLPVAETLKNLGTIKAMVFHSNDGLDEISSVEKTFVAELENNKIKEYEIDPKDFDIHHEDLNDLKIDSPSQSLDLMKTTLQNEGFKSGEDITSLNSAAVIYVSDLVTSFEKGFETAIDVIKSGSGLDKLKELATFSNNFNGSAQ
ncbi:MAG: anthranilate phosphoribosyltransferase [Gammaproteobacteria bacterium]|nr:anthranilate phosphoribosyltransferase [Gammaproteobacteria bacterium]